MCDSLPGEFATCEAKAPAQVTSAEDDFLL